jgi:arginase
MVQVPGSWLRPPEDPAHADSIALLGVPVGVGAPSHGAMFGPEALRAAGLVERLQSCGFSVEDHGDLPPPTPHSAVWPAPRNARHYHEIEAWTRVLSARATTLARSGATPVFLGGDHSLSMGSVNGVARHWHAQGRDLFVLWLDAHADYNTPATTPTGNMHGMSAAFLCGEPGLDDLLGDAMRCPIAPDRLQLFGVRSIDRLERRVLRDRRIATAGMGEIGASGAGTLIRRFIDMVKARNGVLHVSFDVDVLDPTLAPGVGTAVPGGVDADEARLVMQQLRASNVVRSVDIVELNPLLDPDGRTARLAVDLVAELFGRPAAEPLAPEDAMANSDR